MTVTLNSLPGLEGFRLRFVPLQSAVRSADGRNDHIFDWEADRLEIQLNLLQTEAEYYSGVAGLVSNGLTEAYLLPYLSALGIGLSLPSVIPLAAQASERDRIVVVTSANPLLGRLIQSSDLDAPKVYLVSVDTPAAGGLRELGIRPTLYGDLASGDTLSAITVRPLVRLSAPARVMRDSGAELIRTRLDLHETTP